MIRKASAFALAALALVPAASASAPGLPPNYAGSALRAGATGAAGVPGLSESELRSFETRTLGPEHAAEHARERRLIRLDENGVVAQPRATAVQPAPNVGGRWTAPFNLPVIGINSILLPTGKVMLFAYPVNANERYGGPAQGKAAPNTAQAFLWNPANGRFKRVDPPLLGGKPANIWCAGQTLLADGRVLVVGGNLAYAQNGDPYDKPFTGLNRVYTFNPWNETWTEQPQMSHGRWYPSVATVPDGRALIMSGLNEHATQNQFGDTYNPNLGIDAFTPAADLDGRGSIATLGDRRDLREPANGNPPDGGLYPHLFWMPSGRLLVGGPDLADSWFLHYPTANFDLATGWDDIPSASRRRLWGTGVLRPSPTPGGASTTVELLGGTVDESPAADTDAATGNTKTTERFDEIGASGDWNPGASMNVNRSHLNTVLLPDGSMVSIGGGRGTTTQKNQWAVSPTHAERAVELYKPALNTWTLGAAQAEDRAYHSTALLLPDGRVLSAGDDYNGGIDRDTAEIYAPPYLYKADGTSAPRPQLTSAPQTIGYGQAFAVGTPEPDEIARAALVAPGAVTHANDMNQRVVPMSTTAIDEGHVSLLSTSDPDVAPPGWYMLFLLDDNGVPSVARWVLLGNPAPQLGAIEITQRVEQGGGSFSYSGAQFDGAIFAAGATAARSLPGGPSSATPGGHYNITQAAASGYDLVSVDCDDGDSIGSVAFRSVRVHLAAGERVRCTFVNRKRPTPPATGKLPPAKPMSPATTDSQGPSITVTRLNRRRGVLSGRVTDSSGVRRLTAAIAIRRRARCRWWSRRFERLARRAACGRPRWMAARLRSSKGKLIWKVRLDGKVPAGRYLVALKARDKRGNLTRLLGSKAPRVRARR